MDRSGREWMKVVGCGGEWGNVLIWDSLRERDSGAIGVWCGSSVADFAILCNVRYMEGEN